MATTAFANAQELSLVSQFDIPKREPKRELYLNGYFTTWLTDSDLISFGRDSKIKLIDPDNSEVKWAKDWQSRVKGWSVSKSKRRLAISKRIDGVTVFDCKDGAVVFSATDKWLAKKTGVEHFSTSIVEYLPNDGRLLITNSSLRFGENAFLFSEEMDKVEKTIDVDGMSMKITLSSDGNRLVSLAMPKLLTVRDINRNADIYLSGLRPEKATPPPIDSSIFLDAFHDGHDTLVYAESGGWGNGKIGVLSLTNKDSVLFDSLSGWVHMDVDFRNQRIAVTGSSNITIFDFGGKVIASLKNATGQRHDGIEFSPNAKRIMVYNRNSIWVFRFGSKANESQDNSSTNVRTAEHVADALHALAAQIVDDQSWCVCWGADNQFESARGPLMLGEMIERFLKWAEAESSN